MKCAIVYPQIETNFLKRKLFINNNSTIPFHGIGLIISYCNQNNENVDFIDARSFNNYKNFADKIKKYDLVGYSIMSVNAEKAFNLIKVNKDINKNVIICVGGVDPSIRPDIYVDNDLIDQVICGEGEIAFLNLVKMVKNNYLVEKLVFGEKIEDLDTISFIDRSLFPHETIYDYHYYPSENRLDIKMEPKNPYFTFITSRVCKYNCSFCQPVSKKIFGKKERVRTVKNFIDELKDIRRKHGMNSFSIMDDNFLQNRDWIEKFIEMYEETHMDLKFELLSRVDHIYNNRDLIPKLKDIGFFATFIGFESGSDKILKYLKKGTTAILNEKSAQILYDNKISTVASMMFGFPNETHEDYKLTIDFVSKFKKMNFVFNAYNPLPGSALYNELEEKGLIYEKSKNIRFYVFIIIPRIKHVNYFSVNWTILKCGLISSKNNFERGFRIMAFIFSNIVIIFLTLYFILYEKINDNMK
ncbi:MAG: B12-binding domain-containing radical SAM protein [Methanobrevibacter sp.]|jgi:radical SAM superfamily enzyme YgiQ (UPF0313 family)|nr:B12-binding domain-containing radical SAM protein [Methanobrevibacter sp.]